MGRRCDAARVFCVLRNCIKVQPDLSFWGQKNDFSLTPALSPLYTTFPCYYFHSIVVAQLRAIAHYCMQYNQRRRLVKS